MSIRLTASDESTPVKALVDSGSEHILAAPWLAADSGIDLRRPKYETKLGIGGANPNVHFVDVRVQLLHPGGRGR